MDPILSHGRQNNNASSGRYADDDLLEQSQENIMLTWDGNEIQGPEPEVVAQTSRIAERTIPTILPPRSPSPPERPPKYSQARRPTKSICYSFSPMGSNSMVLLPPSDAPDTRPQYYITVSMNCFMPLSHITAVYRGANEYGAAVGEFEMGIINASTSFRMGAQLQTISSALVKSGSRTNGSWTWSPAGLSNRKFHLRWNYHNRPCVCLGISVDVRPKILATFTPRIGLTLERKLSELEVTPDGQEFFDHILMSLLIIERKRLTPGSDPTVKQLFN